MAKLIVPILLALVGLLAGGGAGYFLKPATEKTEATHGHETEPKDGHDSKEADEKHDDTGSDFVKLNNQFVVPVVEAGRVSALVVLSISLEVQSGGSAEVYQMEPKLRDALLRVLFDHANAGGFRGSFTDTANMAVLRVALREAAQRIMGPMISDVLIVDMMRQDS